MGSLSTRVFGTRTATGREHFTCQDSGVSQTFGLIISNGEKIPSNVNVVVRKQVKRENSSLPVAVRVSKTCVLKLPRELNHATFLSQGWKPELNISHARTGIFKAMASTSEKIHNTNVVV